MRYTGEEKKAEKGRKREEAESLLGEREGDLQLRIRPRHEAADRIMSQVQPG